MTLLHDRGVVAPDVRRTFAPGVRRFVRYPVCSPRLLRLTDTAPTTQSPVGFSLFFGRLSCASLGSVERRSGFDRVGWFVISAPSFCRLIGLALPAVRESHAKQGRTGGLHEQILKQTRTGLPQLPPEANGKFQTSWLAAPGLPARFWPFIEKTPSKPPPSTTASATRRSRRTFAPAAATRPWLTDYAGRMLHARAKR